MKKSQSGFTLIELLIVVLGLVFFVAWPVNAYKLSQCDFQAPYHCEVIHGAGIFPALSILTVWFDTDK